MKKVVGLIFVFLLIPSIANALVKIKDVTQSGVGNSGTIKIELNGDYDKSKIKVVYETDHLSLIMNDTFVIPVKRVFKSSSDKSSVSKMEAIMIPITKRSGGTVKLNVYFRLPLELIKKTGSVSGNGKIVTFNYKTVSDQKEAVPVVTTQVQSNTKEVDSTQLPEAGIQDNGDNTISKNPISEDRAKNIEEKTEPLKENIKRVSGFKNILFKFVKIAGALVGFVVVIVLTLFFFKKRSENKVEKKVYTPSNVSYDNGIKVISNSVIDGDKKIFVLDVYGERLLVGTSKHSITLITKLKAKEQPTEETNYEQEVMMRSRLKDKLRNL